MNIKNMDLSFSENFHNGKCFDAYNYMGYHKINGVCVFRVWAPNANAVSLVGDFNAWDPTLSL